MPRLSKFNICLKKNASSAPLQLPSMPLQRFNRGAVPLFATPAGLASQTRARVALCLISVKETGRALSVAGNAG